MRNLSCVDRDGRIQRLLARPPNSKLIINICFISGPKAAKLPKFLYSKFQNCVYLCVYCPKNITSHLLFVHFFLVSDSVPYMHWVGGLGSLYGAIFFSCYVLLGPCPHLQLSSAKETNMADTVKLPRKYLCGGQLHMWVHTR